MRRHPPRCYGEEFLCLEGARHMRNEPLQTARAEDEASPSKRNVKAIVLDEVKEFIGIFAYLLVVFGLFVLHEWIVLSDHHIGYRFYGFALINALILAKIILVAEGLHFADGIKEKPLVYPIVYKSLAFTVLLICAYIAEEV